MVASHLQLVRHAMRAQRGRAEDTGAHHGHVANTELRQHDVQQVAAEAATIRNIAAQQSVDESALGSSQRYAQELVQEAN